MAYLSNLKMDKKKMKDFSGGYTLQISSKASKKGFDAKMKDFSGGIPLKFLL